MKKALLIGINYHGQHGELSGCINDVRNVNKLLVHQLEFSKENIVIMHDDLPRNDHLYPTRVNILREMAKLSKGAKKGDVIFFHYSGHGGNHRQSLRERLTKKDEQDGYDETICPVDYAQAGMIIDDDLRLALVDPLPEGVIFRAIFDCCHSGTVLDLRYNFQPAAGSTEKRARLRDSENRNIKFSKCDALCISGCTDSTTSADTWAEGQATGALTFSILSTLRKYGSKASCGKIMWGITKYMRSNGYSQRPQLSSGLDGDPEDRSFFAWK